ncbi:hypothetical protein PF001_g28171 [Phytophthora fragariae]|nr:hypothetical protein PF001_g28171 [Phytophthora fragariae]
MLFNTRKFLIGGRSVEPTRVDEDRATAFKASLRGTLDKPDIVENILPRYLSLHLVRVEARLPFTHSWDSPNWSESEVLRIRQKYRCDCKAFYVSGWLCPHILAILSILDGFSLNILSKSIPARKPPGRPRKQPKVGQQDTPYTGQNAIPKLLKKLTEKPGFPTNWKVLVPLEIENEQGVTTKNIDGIVRLWFIRDGNYFWKIDFANEDISTEPYDIQELAHVLNFTARSGYSFV